MRGAARTPLHVPDVVGFPARRPAHNGDMTRKQFVAAATSLSTYGQSNLTSVAFLGFPARRSKNEMGSNETTPVTGKDRDEYR